MKQKLSLLFVLVFSVFSILQTVVLADDISLFNNNTATTFTDFAIVDDGTAIVNVNYTGYSDVTTGATIKITIEKKTLLFFWNDVISETYTVNGYRYTNEYCYQLEDTGTYRCTVEYVISGTGGADDVITFENTKAYG